MQFRHPELLYALFLLLIPILVHLFQLRKFKTEAFTNVAGKLEEGEALIVDELNSVQGKAMDLGGYFFTNDDMVSKAMRPSKTFNSILESL